MRVAGRLATVVVKRSPSWYRQLPYSSADVMAAASPVSAMIRSTVPLRVVSASMILSPTSASRALAVPLAHLDTAILRGERLCGMALDSFLKRDIEVIAARQPLVIGNERGEHVRVVVCAEDPLHDGVIAVVQRETRHEIDEADVRPAGDIVLTQNDAA
jgi:hypothetical protein